jgi:hypothetical protein
MLAVLMSSRLVEQAKDPARLAGNVRGCVGHAGDACSTCRSGICGRRDRPGYALPEPGSWSGPIYGELGVIARDDVHAYCHICGRGFRALGHHVWRAHGLWAEEYRALFDLRPGRGLVGRQTRARMAEVAREYLVPHHERALEAVRALPPGQRAASRRGHRLRLETRLGETYLQGVMVRAQATAEHMRQRMQDPVERVRLRDRLAPRGPTRVVCTNCGAAFESRLRGTTLRQVNLVPTGVARRGRRPCDRPVGRIEPRSAGGLRSRLDVVAVVEPCTSKSLLTLPRSATGLWRRCLPKSSSWSGGTSVSTVSQRLRYGSSPWT